MFVAGSLLTRPGQAQYGDLLLGAGTPYRWRTLTGWEDLPSLDSGSVPRSNAHGALPGPLLAQARTVSVDGLVVRAPNSTVGAVVGALNAATAPVEEERPSRYGWMSAAPCSPTHAPPAGRSPRPSATPWERSPAGHFSSRRATRAATA